LQYTNEEIIWKGAIKEEEFEKFFTPPKSLGKSLSSSCDGNTMLDLKEHSTSNFNMWTFGENKIRKEKNGKEKWDVEILVLSDQKEEETIENKSPTVTKINIHEFKAKTTMY
jgi:hypothetical protein